MFVGLANRVMGSTLPGVVVDMGDTTAILIKNYSGRDKLMRTVGYAAVLLSGSTGGAAAQSWYAFSRQVYVARAVHDILSMAVFKDFLTSRKIKYRPKKEVKIIGFSI